MQNISAMRMSRSSKEYDSISESVPQYYIRPAPNAYSIKFGQVGSNTVLSQYRNTTSVFISKKNSKRLKPKSQAES